MIFYCTPRTWAGRGRLVTAHVWDVVCVGGLKTDRPPTSHNVGSGKTKKATAHVATAHVALPHWLAATDRNPR